VEYESTTLICFDGQQYSLCQSLEQIQNQVSQKQYFRVNRQILLNFRAVLEVEHYFARKLFVKLAVPLREKLLVSKERASSFLQWLENR
jgi:DNA-binding LytR/AlgR family response regulator